MKFLWTKDLRLNTVHVVDVARALWAVAALDSEGGLRKGPVSAVEVYNLADENDTDQGSINQHLEAIFGIQTGFQGTIVSQFAKLNLASVTEDVNDEHLQPWSEICKAAGVTATPLTPYLDKELLRDNALSVDGSKIKTTFGFVYERPKMTTDSLREVIVEFEATGVWPKGATN
ncbi:hypothetical protein HK405_001553 [Cladochytrium tenue]|nr:hypothetical protein HK405_001553 [Cladochytrium tenue]